MTLWRERMPAPGDWHVACVARETPLQCELTHLRGKLALDDVHPVGYFVARDYERKAICGEFVGFGRDKPRLPMPHPTNLKAANYCPRCTAIYLASHPTKDDEG